MRVLIACEESQAVCIAMRNNGHEAYSCDIQECSGGHPEWHIMGDALPLINGDCTFATMDGQEHRIDGEWDLLIAHPPCTYLTVAGNRWYDIGKYGDKAVARHKARKEAIDFFMAFANAKCARIAVENPVGVMSSEYKKPDQIIQPYQFGHNARKATCLWLKGLNKLKPTSIVDPGLILQGGYSVGASANFARDKSGKILRWNDPLTAKIRSATYIGIAKAMADQWAGKIDEEENQ